MSKLWGGRFAKKTDSLVHQFNASLHFDVRLVDEDIAGSMRADVRRRMALTRAATSRGQARRFAVSWMRPTTA